MCKIDLNKLSIKELEELEREISKKLTKNKIVEIKVAIDRKQHYVGKCYKKTEDGITQYIMIVSALSSNEFHFDCLIFEDEIISEYRINNKYHFSPNDIYQPIDYMGIRIEDLPLLCNTGNLYTKQKEIEKYTEITEKEFYDAMDNYIVKLKEHLKNKGFNDLSTAKHYERYYN